MSRRRPSALPLPDGPILPAGSGSGEYTSGLYAVCGHAGRRNTAGPYFRPGDPQIGQWLGERAAQHKAFLLANHGPVVVGKSLRDAADNLEEMEASARLFFTLKNSPVNYLDHQQLTVLRGMQ